MLGRFASPENLLLLIKGPNLFEELHSSFIRLSGERNAVSVSRALHQKRLFTFPGLATNPDDDLPSLELFLSNLISAPLLSLAILNATIANFPTTLSLAF